MYAKEAAAEIRSKLKKLGWNSRQVSVRIDLYSMGSSVHIQVKDPSVPLQTVKDIAGSYERVRRCEITHEILSGGNMYVSVDYSSEAREILARRQYDALVSALQKLPENGSNVLEPVTEWAMIGRKNNGHASIWIGDSWTCDFWPNDEGGITHGAYVIEMNRPQ